MSAFPTALPLLPLGSAVLVGLLALALGIVGAVVASRLRTRGVKVAYTRKLFHIVVFTGAGVVHVVWGLAGTLVYGSVVAAVVVVAVVRGDGDPFYEALARDRDRPHRTLFIVIPLVTTALGGLASSLVTGPFAVVGFLAAGWGDAVGEPVGARWGRHPYRVPSLAGVPATRTLEGSLAVLVVASLGSAVAIASFGAPDGGLQVALACGVTAALVEGVSNHGLDNLTVQFFPSVVASILLS